MSSLDYIAGAATQEHIDAVVHRQEIKAIVERARKEVARLENIISQRDTELCELRAKLEEANHGIIRMKEMIARSGINVNAETVHAIEQLNDQLRKEAKEARELVPIAYTEQTMSEVMCESTLRAAIGLVDWVGENLGRGSPFEKTFLRKLDEHLKPILSVHNSGEELREKWREDYAFKLRHNLSDSLTSSHRAACARSAAAEFLGIDENSMVQPRDMSELKQSLKRGYE